MSRPRFCFIESLPPGLSKQAEQIQRKRVRAHAAAFSASSRRKLSNFSSTSSNSSQDIASAVSLSILDTATIGRAFELTTFPESSDSVWSTTKTSSHPNVTFYETHPDGLSSSPNTPNADDDDFPNDLDDMVYDVVQGKQAGLNEWKDLIFSDYCFRGMRTDPFNCIPSRGSECISEVVDYHTQVMAPSHASIYMIFNVTSVFTFCFFELLQNADFIFAGVASVQAVIDQLRRPGQMPSQTVLRHVGKALSNLRVRLEKPGAQADDITIMAVLYLAVIAKAIGDLPCHEVHKNVLRTLVASRGGFNCLGHDNTTRFQLLQLESFWALNSPTGSIFHDSRPPYQPVYPSHPFPPSISSLIAKLPPGFRELALQRKLALDVLDVLARTVDAHRLQGKRLSGSIVTFIDIYGQKSRRYNEFWEATSCLGAPDDPETGEPNLEKLIVLALLLYCMHAFSPMRTVTALYNGARIKLMNDVARRRRGNQEQEDVLLWVWMVMVDSWRGANEKLLPTGLKLLQGLKERRGCGWKEVEVSLERCFSNEKFRARGSSYWDLELCPS